MNQLGRPTKYDPSMIQTAYDVLKKGKSLAQLAAALNITRETLNQWRNDPSKKEFAEAINLGLVHAEAWWEELGRRGAMGKHKINPQVWALNMKNRFGWREKQETEHSGTLETQHTVTDDLIERCKSILWQDGDASAGVSE